MKTRKQKVLAGILIPTSTLLVAAGATAGIICGLNSNKSTTNYLNPTKVTFSAGEGSFVNGSQEITTEAGTKFDRIDQPAVKANKANKTFAGWVDESGHPVYGQAQVTKDMKLHAVYNDDSDEYVTITFALDQKGPTLQGNLNVSVNKGYFFFMVNRPSAKWVVTDGSITKTKYFKGWRFEDGSMIEENQVIDTNLTLYPVFTEAVTVKWDAVGFNDTETGKEPPAGKGSMSRGQDYTTLEYGTKFDLFNQPGIEYVYDDPSHTDNAYFAGWYYDTEGKSPVKPNDEVTGDITVHAKWSKDPDIGEQYGTLEFSKTARSTDAYGQDLPAGMTFSYTPTDKIVVVLNTRRWGDTNKPTLLCYDKDGTLVTDYKVDHWEIQTGTDTWEEIGDEFTFSAKENVVRPVLTYAIDRIQVYGASSIEVEGTENYGVLVYGGASSAASKVTWMLTTDDSGADVQFPQGIAQISKEGVITVKSVTRELWEQYNFDHFFVKATSQLDTTKTSYLRVNIKMPYENNRYVWIHTESSESSNPKWYKANIDDFCDTSKTAVIATGMDGTTTKTFSKSASFTDKIQFGTNLAEIPANFLAGWTNFNADIDFANSNVIVIGENFLAGCTSFNKQLDLNKIQVIKTNFLKGCVSYNQPIVFNSTAALLEIGENFLGLCTGFDSTVTLPTVNKLWINRNFMFGCTAFNQPIEIPNTVYYIGDNFMNSCNSFTSTLTVSCPMDGFVEAEGTLSSPDVNASIYTLGFTVDGTQAENFKKIYKTSKVSPYYRTIRESSWTGEVTNEVFAAGMEEVLKFDNMTLYNDLGEIQLYSSPAYKKTSNDARVAPYEKARAVFADDPTDPIWIQPQDESLGYLRYTYYKDKSGKNIHFGQVLTPDSTEEYSPDYWIREITNIVCAEEWTGGSWTIDRTNQWYNIVVKDNTLKFVMRFAEATKKIDFVGIQYAKDGKNWVTQFAANISGIGKTTISDWPTDAIASHTKKATWGTDSYTVEAASADLGEQNVGYSFRIDSNGAGNKYMRTGLYASASATSAYERYKDLARRVEVYRTDTTSEGSEVTHVLDTCGAVVDPATNELILVFEDFGEFTANDIVIIKSDIALSGTTSVFKAKPENANIGLAMTTLKANYKENITQALFKAHDGKEGKSADELTYNTSTEEDEYDCFAYNSQNDIVMYYQVWETNKLGVLDDANSKIVYHNGTETVEETLAQAKANLFVDYEEVTDASATQRRVFKITFKKGLFTSSNMFQVILTAKDEA